MSTGLNVFNRSLSLENTPKFCIIKVLRVICLPDNFSFAVFGLRGKYPFPPLWQSGVYPPLAAPKATRG